MIFLQKTLLKKKKLKYKKARIKQFKSLKNDEEEDYDYYPNGRRYFYPTNEKNNTFKFERNSKKVNEQLFPTSDKNNRQFKLDNSNKKVRDHSYTKREISNGIFKNIEKKYINTIRNMSSSEDSDDEEIINSKNKKNLTAKNKNKIKKIKNGRNNIEASPNINKTMNTMKPQIFRNKKINVIINKNNNSKSNNTQYNINTKLQFEEPVKTSTSNNNRKNNNTFYLVKSSKKPKPIEMGEIDAIKSKFKIRLIEINDKLSDAIHYYNGPIDISCISCENYTETVNSLTKRVLKNGYKCIKHENNYFKFTNGINLFFVEIVKIRNNMLYYLVIKNQQILFNYFQLK